MFPQDKECRMTLILVVLVLSSIAAMAWAFSAARKLEVAAAALEERVKTRLDLPPHPAAASDKGVSP
jgi:hypothetical protein